MTYLALELSGITAKLVGIEGLTFGAWDVGVKVNKATDATPTVLPNPAKLNWAGFTETPTASRCPTWPLRRGPISRCRVRWRWMPLAC